MHERLEVLSHGDVVHGLLEVFGHSKVSILLSEELCTSKIALDVLEELCDSDIVFLSQVLGHGNIILSLVEEFGHRDVILCEELSDRNVVSNLLEVVAYLVLKEFGHSDIVRGCGKIHCWNISADSYICRFGTAWVFVPILRAVGSSSESSHIEDDRF